MQRRDQMLADPSGTSKFAQNSVSSMTAVDKTGTAGYATGAGVGLVGSTAGFATNTTTGVVGNTTGQAGNVVGGTMTVAQDPNAG